MLPELPGSRILCCQQVPEDFWGFWEIFESIDQARFAIVTTNVKVWWLAHKLACEVPRVARAAAYVHVAGMVRHDVSIRVVVKGAGRGHGSCELPTVYPAEQRRRSLVQSIPPSLGATLRPITTFSVSRGMAHRFMSQLLCMRLAIVLPIV